MLRLIFICHSLDIEQNKIMTESLSGDPYHIKYSYERKVLAKQLSMVRTLERKSLFNRARDEESYIADLGGLSLFLNYVKHNPFSNVVLDIGAGVTRGIAAISRSKEGQGLKFKATNLAYHSLFDSDEGLGSENVKLTSVELLEGIADDSVGGVIALFSIAYSIDPSRAIDMIDRKLVSGGIFKSTFRGTTDTEYSKDKNYLPHDLFSCRLSNLGYDLGINEGLKKSTILAIKKGSSSAVSAQVLLDQDREQYFDTMYPVMLNTTRHTAHDRNFILYPKGIIREDQIPPEVLYMERNLQRRILSAKN